MLLLLFVAAIAQPFVSYATFDIGNDPGCQCLNTSVHDNTKRINGNDACLDTRIVLDLESGDQESFCYPETYGIGCDTHDMNLAPFCHGKDDVPLFCSRPFCYVDPDQCFTSNSTIARSQFFPELFYSYETCGEVDAFREFTLKSELVGRTLKVGVPALLYPDHYRLDENGDPILFSDDIFEGVGELRGIFIDFLHAVASDGNFEVEFHAVTLAAYEGQEWSAWGGCIFDVNRGVLDVCVGNFWETTFRRSMVSFTTPLLTEKYYLMVPKPQAKNGVLTKLSLIFEPFTTSLWGVIVIVTFLVGIVYTILGPDRKDSHQVGIFSFRYTDIVENVYFAWSELMQGSDSSGDKTVAQRSLALTWSFFILIVIAAYTANLAAFLGREKVLFKFLDITGCMKADGLVCIENSNVLERSLETFYPTLRHNIYGDPVATPDFEANPTCDAVLMSEYAWDINPQIWGQCDNIFLGNSVISFIVAWPVTLSISEPLSYWMSKSIEEKGFDRIMELYTPPPRCDKTLAQSESDKSDPKIDIASMAGPLLFLGAGTLFGIFLKQRSRLHSTPNDHPEIENGNESKGILQNAEEE